MIQKLFFIYFPIFFYEKIIPLFPQTDKKWKTANRLPSIKQSIVGKRRSRTDGRRKAAFSIKTKPGRRCEDSIVYRVLELAISSRMVSRVAVSILTSECSRFFPSKKVSQLPLSGSPLLIGLSLSLPTLQPCFFFNWKVVD